MHMLSVYPVWHKFKTITLKTVGGVAETQKVL